MAHRSWAFCILGKGEGEGGNEIVRLALLLLSSLVMAVGDGVCRVEY
jgi:hypothetical protein